MTLPERNLFQEGTLLAGKLKPPRLRYVLERPRLLRMATPVDKEKLVLVCAGPGFGKTTLMAQIARYHPGGSVWYQIDTLDHDPAVFLRHLIFGISQACSGSGIGERSMARLREASDARREGESVLAVLAGELGEKLNSPLGICFDDFHFFDGVEFAPRFMKCFLEELPDNCAVFISSRTRPELKLGRMRSQGSLLEVNSGDLQFSRDEINELMVETWDLQVDDETLAQLHKNTEGWAAGLVLVEDNLRSGIAVPELFSGRKVRQHVYEYLAEEVLARQSGPLKDLMEKSALIDPVDPHICRRALGVKDAPALLAAAEKMNLFTTRVDDSNLYRYHPLFRENLMARLEDKLGQGEIQDLRLRFGAAFESAGEKNKAVEQYLKSGRSTKAASLIEEIGAGMIKNGEYVTLERWISELSGELSPALEMYRGKLLLLAGKPHECLSLLRGTQSCLKADDKELTCEIAATIAECLRLLGKYREGIKKLLPLMNLDLSLVTRLNLLFRLSSCYWHDYDKEGFRNCVQETEKLVSENPSKQLHYKVNIMKAIDNLRNGIFLDARRLLSEVVEACEVDASNKNLSINNLAACLMMLGDYEEGKKLAELCMSIVKSQKDGKLIGMIYDTYGGILAGAGNWPDGKKFMEKAINEGSKLDGCDAYFGLTKCHLGTYARRFGEYSEGKTFHSQSLETALSFNDQYGVTMCMLNLGADLARMCRHPEAEEYFSKACAIAYKHNFQYALTQIDFHQAWNAHVNGDQEKELQCIAAALKRANKYQHNHFLIQEGKISLPLFVNAINHDIEADYVFWILKRIGPPALMVAASILGSKRKEVRIRCARLLGSISDPNSISLARKMLRDPDKEVRAEARKSLQILRGHIKTPNDLITQRESQVMEMIAGGASNKKIAQELFISERTVKTHITNIFRKLGLTTRLEAALYYQKSMQKNTTS